MIRTVLLVEASPELRRTLEAGLELGGYAVRSAETVGDALALLARHPAHLIVVDASDGGEGPAVQAEIERAFPDTPSIVLSRDGFDPALLHPPAPGEPGPRLLPTPFTLAELLALVDSILGPPAPRRS